MTAFEEALVAVMALRVQTGIAAMKAHARLVAIDHREAIRALGDAHDALLRIQEDIGCLRRLHEMTDDLERQSA